MERFLSKGNDIGPPTQQSWIYTFTSPQRNMPKDIHRNMLIIGILDIVGVIQLNLWTNLEHPHRLLPLGEVMKQMMPPPIMLHQTDGAASCLCLWVSLSCPSAYSSHPSSIPCAAGPQGGDTVRHGWCLKPVQLLNLTCSAHVKSITLHITGEIKLEIYKLHRQN